MTIGSEHAMPRPRTDEEAVAAETVVTFTSLWASGQDEAAMAFLDDNAVYDLHIGDAPLDYNGRAAGKAAIIERCRRLREDWEYVLWRPGPYTVEGSIVRQQNEFMLKWRATGETFSSRSRYVWTIRNGLIIDSQEYLDGPMAEAFMRLVGQSVKPTP